MNYKCPECNGNLIQTESDIVCMSCGLVMNQIYEKPTIQLINAENSFGSQYGSISERPSNMKTLGTFVGAYRKHHLIDTKGSLLKISAKRRFKRLKTLNDVYLHFNGRQREYRGYHLLARVCSSLQITDAAKANALYLFKKVNPFLSKEIKLSSLIMGALYLSIRSRRENIELARLVLATQSQGYSVRGKDIIKAASMIRQYVKIRVCHVKSEEYLDNILSRLQRDSEVANRIKKRVLDKNEYFICLKLGAKKLFLNFPKTNRGGRNPFILAASIIIASDILLARHIFFPHCYIRSSKRGILTQKHLANILNIAEFTLREHYLLLAKPLLESLNHVKV